MKLIESSFIDSRYFDFKSKKLLSEAIWAVVFGVPPFVREQWAEGICKQFNKMAGWQMKEALDSIFNAAKIYKMLEANSCSSSCRFSRRLPPDWVQETSQFKNDIILALKENYPFYDETFNKAFKLNQGCGCCECFCQSRGNYNV